MGRMLTDAEALTAQRSVDSSSDRIRPVADVRRPVHKGIRRLLRSSSGQACSTFAESVSHCCPMLCLHRTRGVRSVASKQNFILADMLPDGVSSAVRDLIVIATNRFGAYRGSTKVMVAGNRFPVGGCSPTDIRGMDYRRNLRIS